MFKTALATSFVAIMAISGATMAQSPGGSAGAGGQPAGKAMDGAGSSGSASGAAGGGASGTAAGSGGSGAGATTPGGPSGGAVKDGPTERSDAPASKGASADEPVRKDGKDKSRTTQTQRDDRGGKGTADTDKAEPPIGRNGQRSTSDMKDQKQRTTDTKDGKQRANTDGKDQKDRDRVKSGDVRDGRNGGSAATGSSDGTPNVRVTVQLSQDQQTRARTVFTKYRSRAVVNVNITPRIGIIVPRTVRLVAVPQEIFVIVPEYRAYRYFIVGNQVVIVDPNTFTVVDVILLS